MSIYLDFEEPIKAIEEQIEKTKEIGDTSDPVSYTHLTLPTKA